MSVKPIEIDVSLNTKELEALLYLDVKPRWFFQDVNNPNNTVIVNVYNSDMFPNGIQRVKEDEDDG